MSGPDCAKNRKELEANNWPNDRQSVLDFRYVAPFRNESDSKATVVEISHFLLLVTLVEEWAKCVSEFLVAVRTEPMVYGLWAVWQITSPMGKSTAAHFKALVDSVTGLIIITVYLRSCVNSCS